MLACLDNNKKTQYNSIQKSMYEKICNLTNDKTNKGQLIESKLSQKCLVSENCVKQQAQWIFKAKLSVQNHKCKIST